MAAGNPPNTSQDDTDLSESQLSQSKKSTAKKAKAGFSKKMTAKEQSERFIETARELGVDENDEALDLSLIHI